MTAQPHPLLATLHEWEQITIPSVQETNSDIQPDETAIFVCRLTQLKRGKAQQLPSAVLKPV